eukprot:symbB.v1.2.016128.t1/scaffold1221.1/size130907/4
MACGYMDGFYQWATLAKRDLPQPCCSAMPTQGILVCASPTLNSSSRSCGSMCLHWTTEVLVKVKVPPVKRASLRMLLVHGDG